MVFYRKYRPQTIEELDSLEIREKLSRVLSGANPPHAYLFSGPKGLGKTSTARIVAKALNCEKKTKGVEPCNKCDQCLSITNGTNMDVLEIDGASNRGIDEIRDLREKVRLSAVSASKKVYIIDEVHMLTTEAFNALLKTLEEPPSHVVFILCTTELHKVPPTIASRCFQILFTKATNEELVRSFERIVKKEKIEADKEVMKQIANLSDGSFRDGVKILEELVPYRKVTKELLETKYHVQSVGRFVISLMENLVKRDTKRGLELVSELVDQGVDMKYFMEQLINELHSFLLYKLGIKNEKEFTVNNLQLTINDIKQLVELLSKAIGELKYAVLPQLPLELAIVEWSVAALRSPSQLGGSSAAPHQDGLDTFWKELIDKVKAQNQSAAGVLRGCSIKSYNDKELVLETGFKFHKERLDEPNAKELVKKVVSEIAGKEVTVSILLKEVK